MFDPFAGQKDLAAGYTPLRRRCGGAIRRRCAAHASLYSFCLDLWTGGRGEYVASAACASSAAAPHRYGARAQRAAAHGRRPSPRAGCAVTAGEPPTAHLKKQLPLPFERWLAWDDALDAVSALEGQHDRWAMLLMLLEMPADIVRTALQELTFSRADCEAVVAVLALREAVAAQLRAALRRTPQRCRTRLRWSGSGSLARCAAAKPLPALCCGCCACCRRPRAARRARALLANCRAGAAAPRG